MDILWILVGLGVLAGLNFVLLLWLLLRKPPAADHHEILQAIAEQADRTQRELRHEIADSARGSRQESTQALAHFQQAVLAQGSESTRTQNAQIDAFAHQLANLQKMLADTLHTQLQDLIEANSRRLSEVRSTMEAQLGALHQAHTVKLDEVTQSTSAARREQGTGLANFQNALVQQGAETARAQSERLDAFARQIEALRESLAQALVSQLQSLGESNARRIAEVRSTMETQLAQLQASNATKLDEMRQVVDQKLQSTLEARLGESFRQVAERLEQVYRGLGEMQTLAQGVGDLKHLPTNVKTRGMFGEAQLGALLEQVMSPEQYAEQVATRPGSRAVVDFAIRLPGRGDDGQPVWLPIDAKFPNEDYERLLDAQQRADAEGAAVAAKALEARIRLEARGMADKYLEPPHTTDYAILFLPTEGLYAEGLRRPGLVEALQRESRVSLAGPTTLLAMLNSLQMGFRTLALEKRSSEVWQVLGSVKSEFLKFGGVLADVRRQTQTVLNTLDKAQTRTNVLNRKLREVEALPEANAQGLLAGLDAPEVDGDEEDA